MNFGWPWGPAIGPNDCWPEVGREMSAPWKRPWEAWWAEEEGRKKGR